MRENIKLLLILLATACSTQSKIRITSYPEKAEVKAVSHEGETKILGTTPLDVSGADLFSSGSRMTYISVSKESYEQQNIFVAQEAGVESYDIKVKLKPQADDPKIADTKVRQERLAKNLAKANNLISTKRYDEAERLLHILSQEYPYVSVSYDLLGNISYFRRDIKTALNFYEKSYRVNPENSETKTMIDKLKGMVN